VALGACDLLSWPHPGSYSIPSTSTLRASQKAVRGSDAVMYMEM